MEEEREKRWGRGRGEWVDVGNGERKDEGEGGEEERG